MSVPTKKRFSIREAAKKVGVTIFGRNGQRSATAESGGVTIRLCSERDIESAKLVLADIKPGREKKK